MIVEKVSENVPNVKAMIGQKTSPDCEYPSKLMFLKSYSSSYLAVDEMLRSGLTVAAVDSVEQIQKSMDPDDPAVVYATSGSTGTPKLIVHSHFNMINIAGLYRSVVDEGNVVYNDSPFNWMGSMLFNGLTNNMCRVHLVAPTARQDEFARLLFRIFRQERVTSAMILTYILQVRASRPGVWI
jgi:acyl-coenzyme A synthetase/AMP-(fatty) acid ligase